MGSGRRGRRGDILTFELRAEAQLKPDREEARPWYLEAVEEQGEEVGRVRQAQALQTLE